VTVNQILVDAVRRLTAAGVPEAAKDARILLAHTLGVDRSKLISLMNDDMTADQRDRYDALIMAREQRRPVSHLVGTREFYGRAFKVSGDVLDPRPDTETLIDVALAQPFGRVLDLGTGSGCILLTLLCENASATGVGVDASRDALAVAADNAQTLDVQARSDFQLSDWFQNVTGEFDLIVSNPPYISADEFHDLAPEVQRWEPKMALTPGGDGLDAYRHIAARAGAFLSANGRIVLEIGPTQAEAVVGMLSDAGFADVRVIKDINGRDRVVYGAKHANSS